MQVKPVEMKKMSDQLQAYSVALLSGMMIGQPCMHSLTCRLARFPLPAPCLPFIV